MTSTNLRLKGKRRHYASSPPGCPFTSLDQHRQYQQWASSSLRPYLQGPHLRCPCKSCTFRILLSSFTSTTQFVSTVWTLQDRHVNSFLHFCQSDFCIVCFVSWLVSGRLPCIFEECTILYHSILHCSLSNTVLPSQKQNQQQ